MNALAHFTRKLAPLIRCWDRRLSERLLGPVAQGGRLLNTARLDMNNLALVVERDVLPVVVGEARNEPAGAPGLGLWQILAMDFIWGGSGRLNPVELDYVPSMAHWPAEPSAKQGVDAKAAALGVKVA